jgi:pimeloyl-ACP methyl ester carboxylesterase
MRRSLTAIIILSASILILLLAGCYEPGGPVPEGKHSPAARDWTTQEVDAAVTMTMESIYSPAPTGNGTPPEECNYIQYLRFRPKEGSGDLEEADAIIVLIPGLLGGANSLECISRQMVYMALKQRGINIEVLALDRRPNNIEDLTGMEAAEEAQDIQVAIDYYYHGAEIDGHKFAGFLTDADVPYLSEFGLELTMRDIYTVITTNVPDPEVRRRKVFVGGHSMGGPYAAFFAGWDFDGDPATLDDAGYMNCAGLIGLDTVLVASIYSMEAYVEDVLGEDVMSDNPSTPQEQIYTMILEAIREGSLPRMVTPVSMLAVPETLALIEIMSMEATWHPDEESDLLDRIPYSGNVALMLQLLHSRSLAQFTYHAPSMKDFRFTNEALFGIMLDDNFQPINPLQASMGFLDGGAVVDKQFPLYQDLESIPLLSILRNLVNMEGQFIANDAGPSYFEIGNGPLYTWANFDEIGDSADPDYQDERGTLTYTTITEEVSDIQDVARFMHKGPTNALEWYFATRPFLDMAMAMVVKDFGSEYGLTLFHSDKIAGMPQIDFMAEKGPMIGLEGLLPPEIRVIKGYNHLDVCVAAPDRSALRENEVIDPILDFILANIPGS